MVAGLLCNSHRRCPVTDDASYQLYEACLQGATRNNCKAYAQASCADIEVDGGAAAACFVGQTFHDLYASVAPIFCGGGTDGGAADAAGD
ncbi:MAG: hypothetical protein H7066_11030 [Cytophagaceae bacterium]|nr:hypothetical protein [Gemmatimonadaceae bacterium]